MHVIGTSLCSSWLAADLVKDTRAHLLVVRRVDRLDCVGIQVLDGIANL